VAIAVLVVLFFSALELLPASGSGILTFGDPLPAAGAGVGRRQLVRLEKVGAILRGTPSAGQLAMVTLRTRHPVPESSLVLWERRSEDGSSLIQISVPPRLASNIVGATLFFPAGDSTARVAQSRDGRWVDLEPVAISRRTEPASASAQPALQAYPVATLGFFVRSELEPADARAYPPTDPNAFDMSTRAARAAWHLLWPVALLIALMGVSKRYHGRGAP
jgi:hypothetical protein